MTKVDLFYYLYTFDAYITTIIAWFLLISPDKVPAEGKAALLQLCRCCSGVGSGSTAVRDRLMVTQEESGVSPGAELGGRHPLLSSS